MQTYLRRKVRVVYENGTWRLKDAEFLDAEQGRELDAYVMVEVEDVPQYERIHALLDRWEAEPDDTPAAWWEEFDQFLRENRLNIPERDLGLDDA